MNVYADTSFFVSLYLPDAHSLAARRLGGRRNRIWLTPLHRAEWAHAIAQHVFRRELTAREAEQVASLFEHDRAKGIWQEAPLPELAFERCVEIARTHGARLGIRTMDSLHVACALLMGAERFWTFDQRQKKLARVEKLVLR